MANKVGVPLAVAGAVAAVVVIVGAIFLFTDTSAVAPGSDQPAGPAPTTRLSLSDPDPNRSSTAPTPDDRYPPVPAEQVDGDLVPAARTEGRNLYIPVQDNDCSREQVWPRGEHADRVEVEIRPLPITPPPGMTGDSYGCVGSVDRDGPYAVVELAEPLGDRRLVVTYVFPTPPH